MTLLRVLSLLSLLVAVVFLVRGDGAQGSVLIALAVVFLVVGERTSRSSD